MGREPRKNMNEPPLPLSEERLSELFLESRTLVQKKTGSTTAVFDRVRRFARIYEDIASKPDVVSLLFRESENGPVRSQPVGEKLLVGRLPKNENSADGCDLAFDDDKLSRRHFEISRSSGLYLLRDLESRNGTYVNNDPTRIREIVLKAGDLIFAGHLVFAFTGE